MCAARSSAAGWKAAALLAAAASIGLAFFLANHDNPQPVPMLPVLVQEEDQSFPVATASEVVVSRVEGADTHSLVVATFPVQEPLELAGPGDVTFGQNIQAHVQVGGSGRPMVWARVGPDE